jgi:hypothetical protein
MRLVNLSGHLSSKSSILDEVNPVAFGGFSAVSASKILGSSGQLFEPRRQAAELRHPNPFGGSWEDLQGGALRPSCITTKESPDCFSEVGKSI